MIAKAFKHVGPCLNSIQGLLEQHHQLKSLFRFLQLKEDQIHFPLPATKNKEVFSIFITHANSITGLQEQREREEMYDEIKEPIKMEFTEKSRNKDFGEVGRSTFCLIL